MLSLQEMSDRLEIQDLFARYAFAIDDRAFDRLDTIFTPDATIDYGETGGARGSLMEIKQWLPGALARFPCFQHLVATTELTLDGDRATSRTILFNPMVHADAAGVRRTFFVGLWYRDTLVRTGAGWRIASRHEQLAYVHNAPDDIGAIPAVAPPGPVQLTLRRGSSPHSG